MTNNEFLQRAFEANPDQWMPQGWKPVAEEWADTPIPSWHCAVDWRLRPILPASLPGLPKPPEEAYLYGPERGGFFFGLLPRKMLHQTPDSYFFAGWYAHRGYAWGYSKGFVGLSREAYYILDVSDPNSRAILKENGLWPGEGEPKAPKGPSDRHSDRLDKLDKVADRLWDALIDLGWTPPDGLTEEARKCYSMTGLKEFVAKHFPHARVVEDDDKRDDWVRLDKSDVEVLDDSEERMLWVPGWPWDAVALRIIKRGPESVRIRRRDGGGL